MYIIHTTYKNKQPKKHKSYNKTNGFVVSLGLLSADTCTL